MTRCPYYYHTMTNVPPRRCDREEGHIEPHREEQLTQPQEFVPFTGWKKH